MNYIEWIEYISFEARHLRGVVALCEREAGKAWVPILNVP
jgi:hypothetical protein